MRDQRRRARQQPPSPPVSLLPETGQGREQAFRAEPVLPSLQPARARPVGQEVTPPARGSGSQLDQVPSLPPGRPHPYPPDRPIERQTHVWIDPATPRWIPPARRPRSYAVVVPRTVVHL